MKLTRMRPTTRAASPPIAAFVHRLAVLIAVIAVGRIATTVTANTIDDLDEALLNDIVESYYNHEPTECTAASSSSSYGFDWPGTNNQSGWNPDFPEYEEGLFQAAFSHTDDDAAKSWSIRVGSGGNMYSILFPNSLGEIIPPQHHSNAPWIDEVQQIVSVATGLNQNIYDTKQCHGGALNVDNDDLCKKYYIHTGGSYQRDGLYTKIPFYSPSLAKHCSGNTCTFASWGMHAHVVSPFTSPALYINRYTNCNNGIIEHTQMIHNFASPSDPLYNVKSDLNHFNVGWGGVRPSKLPFVLEPNTADALIFENANTVDVLPLCLWSGSDPRGRAEPKNLPSTGGYTTFVENGLLVNTTLPKLLPPCRKPNVTCGTNIDASSCMVETCSDLQISTQGYVRMALKVSSNSSPNCEFVELTTDGLVSLRCDFHDLGFGRSNPSSPLTSYGKCAPWTDIGLFNSRTGQGLNIFHLKQWSNGPTSKKMIFTVYATNRTASINTVNAMFSNVGHTTELDIELRPLRKNRESLSSPGTTIQSPTMGIPFQTLPVEYNPSALKTFTYVYGKGGDYPLNNIPGLGRRRMGSSSEIGGRDYTVFSVNWQTGASLKPSETYTNRGYYFASNLGSVKATADSLRNKVVIDKIEWEQWKPRKIQIYKRNANFVVQSAPSSEGLSTTCASSSASLACSGWSTPRADHVPYFYVKCQNSTYLGPNPYRFTPSFGSRFPDHGSNADSLYVRPYVCDGMIWTGGRERNLNYYPEDDIDNFRGEDVAESVTSFEPGQNVPFDRPTWKLMGFFPISDASCASLEADTYEETVCDPDPTSSPSSSPTHAPTSLPTTTAPSSSPSSSPSTSKPTSCGIPNDGRMIQACPCITPGTFCVDTTGQCCSKYCRLTHAGPSYCKAGPTRAPTSLPTTAAPTASPTTSAPTVSPTTSRPTTSKPTSCIANDARMIQACPCGTLGTFCVDTTGQCCSKYCRLTNLGASFCKASSF